MSNKKTLFRVLVLECAEHSTLLPDRFQTIQSLLPGPYVNSMDQESNTPLVYHASMHPQLLKLFIDHGATLDTQKHGEKNVAIHTWRLHRWRDDFFVTPEAKSQQLTDDFVQSIALIAAHSHINFHEGKKDVNGSRHLSFLHNLFWIAPSDTVGAQAMSALIEAGLPVCDDLIGDSRLVKDKPRMRAVVENAMLHAEVDHVSTSLPSRRKVM